MRHSMREFEHPRRFRRNVSGPFYTLGSAEAGDCLFCGTPEDAAPSLLHELDDDDYNTYFVRQPDTPEEVEAACSAIESCCVSALRYCGTDPEIIRRLGNSPEFSDFVLDRDGELILATRADGSWPPEVAREIERQPYAKRNSFAATVGSSTIQWRLPWADPGELLPTTPARAARRNQRLVWAAIGVSICIQVGIAIWYVASNAA